MEMATFQRFTQMEGGVLITKQSKQNDRGDRVTYDQCFRESFWRDSYTDPTLIEDNKKLKYWSTTECE